MDRYFFIQLSFLLLTFIFFGLLYQLLRQALMRTTLDQVRKDQLLKRWGMGWIAWLVFVSAWSLSGMMINFEIFPFNFLPVVGFALCLTVWLCLFSSTTGLILDQLANHQIIRLQVFRVFVEILLWLLLLENLLPIQMSFEGRNFDVLAGLTAPIVAYLSQYQKVSKKFLMVWNILSLGLLLNIVTIAILSIPSPFRYFMNEPANTIVARFPIALLPTFLVPLALGLHLLSLRKLSRINS